MDTTDVIVAPQLERQLDDLARRYRRAGNPGLQLLVMLGGQAENLLERLPDSAKGRLEEATLRALQIATDAAAGSRAGAVPDGPDWAHALATTAMGAAGGMGGLPTALAELPVTTTTLLRAIQSIAAQHGFDTDDPDIRAACLQVFAAAGPLAEDDGADMGFLAVRVTLTGPATQTLLTRIAPKLAAALGKKLAAQTVPVIGAAAGAAANLAFTRYYQEIAHVSFGLKALARDTGQPEARLTDALRSRMAPVGIKR